MIATAALLIYYSRMMTISTAYKFLELNENASQDEVYASYRRLIKEYHPDRNSERSDWSHSMTIRLTEAYEAVLAYLENIHSHDTAHNASTQGTESDEPDSGYSLATQGRIAGLYDQILNHIHSYYNEGMDKIYLRQEGSLRHRFRSLLRRLKQTIEGLSLTAEMPGSALQHKQITCIEAFARAFYENLLIKPKEQEAFSDEEAKAQRLYRQASLALDRAIYRGLLQMELDQGLICPGERDRSEKSIMLLLASYPRSAYVPESLIKLYLLKCLSALCDLIEQN